MHTWTFEKPKSEGYYWFRSKEYPPFSAQEPRVVYVDSADGLWEFQHGDLELFGDMADVSDRIEWAGPIQEPVEP